MKIALYLLLFFFLGKPVFASEPVMIWVEFQDKEYSGYSLTRPDEFLSPRAIERRQKQNIPFDFYDLPVSASYIDSILKDPTLSLHYTSKWFNGALFKANLKQSVTKIRQFGFVRHVEIAKKPISSLPVKEKGIQSVSLLHPYTKPVLNGFQQYTTTIADYGEATEQIAMLNAQSLHENGFWGQNKVIAVLDAGFRNVDTLPAYSELWNNNQILGFYDFVQAKPVLYNDHSHGAYVLSVMGANQPGFSGTARQASYWLIRTEDAATEFQVEEYNWLAGAEFADSVGADIINSSLGYTVFDDTLQNYRYSDLDGASTIAARAANMAFSRGMLVVNSAGNYGSRNWRYIGTPADAHGVLAVGGTDNSGIIASFSSVGPSYDGRVKPQVTAQGQGVAVINNFGSVSRANGTSFSAPLIAGMAASLWSKYPDASNSQIKQAIIRSSDRYFAPDSLYGFGIPDFEQASIILEKKIDDDSFLKLINNPLQSESSITFYAYQEEEISIDIFNSSGQLVWARDSLLAYSGFNEIKPFGDIDILTSGIYLIRVNFSNRTETIKTIKF